MDAKNAGFDAGFQYMQNEIDEVKLGWISKIKWKCIKYNIKIRNFKLKLQKWENMEFWFKIKREIIDFKEWNEPKRFCSWIIVTLKKDNEGIVIYRNYTPIDTF